MAKLEILYRCTQCNNTFPKWSGKCLSCAAWSTLEKVEANGSSGMKKALSVGESGKLLSLSEIEDENFSRLNSNVSEFDRCLGGGIVPGSVVLLGGDPGVGKSTLALQIANNLVSKNIKVVYVCGEESPKQIKMRAARLNENLEDLHILPDTNINNILASLVASSPDFVVIDSIQTIYNPDIGSGAGSISQVSDCTNKLIETAKKHNIATLIIGHVTKDGYIAGPKTLEHMVDVVLYIEGERFQHLRLLRAVKNRFGGVHEVGIFEMQGQGLIEVINPSKIFLGEGMESRIGSSFTAVFEGSRVLAVEIQSLLSKSSLAYPKRTALGFDKNRLGLLLAVLGKHGKLPTYEQDVYVNVTGGLKINEPACDLAVAAAIAGSLLDKPLPQACAVFGEIGLSGEIRAVNHLERRIKELERLGFKHAVVPAKQKIGKTSLKLIKAGDIKNFLQSLFK